MYNISLITGDGIGPEISESMASLLDTVNDKLGVSLRVEKLDAGDGALSKTGKALPDDTISKIKASDACLKAPVGENAADVIIVLRRILGLFANIRPAKSYPGMPALRDDIDLVIVRENTEDVYIGKEFEIDGSVVALRVISEKACRDIAEYAFWFARQRDYKKRVTCVHKSNVMRKSDGLFYRVCNDVAGRQDNSAISFESMYVDACAMNLIRQPHLFDVIVTTNLFGDILSDEAAQVVGGLGFAPAANLGSDFGLFEPVHGAAFDIAGKGISNPAAFLLSAKMMFDWLGMKYNDKKCIDAAGKIESAVYGVVSKGVKTKDIGGDRTTVQFTNDILSGLV